MSEDHTLQDCGHPLQERRGSRDLVKRKKANDIDKPDEVTQRGGKKPKCQSDEYLNMDINNTQLHGSLQGNSKAKSASREAEASIGRK